MISENLKSKLTLLLLGGILILGIVLRSYKLNEALGDWHSWRQADTASVAREYIKNGDIDLLNPRFHDLSSIPSGLDNPQGFRYVEFPLRDGLHALLAKSYPTLGFLAWGRVLSIIFTTITTATLYLIVSHVSGRFAALVTALLFATLPYNMFYGRVILPEPMLVMFTFLTLLFYLKFIDTNKIFYWLFSTLCFVFALLLKPTALTILIPMSLLYLVSKKNLSNTLLSLILPLLAIIPYILWRRYIHSYPEGIPANSWLFNSNNIRFKGAWFRWLFGERIAKLILGYWALIPVSLGIFSLGRNKKETMLGLGLLLSSLSYLAIIATGNVQHDYYQIQIIPTLCILGGIGVSYFYRLYQTLFSRIFYLGLIGFCILLGIALSWYEVKGYFWVNNRAMVKAGVYIDQNTPENALVIAPYQGDTAFLYQTNRRGWPIGGDIDKKIKSGASYYVTTTRDQEFQELKAKYSLIIDNDEFAVIRLGN